MRDDEVRSGCFASLDVLLAKFGEDVPYVGGLADGFPFRGRRVPFLARMKGIHRAAAQSGPAALSILTSASSPYGDEETEDGVLYAYRAGAMEQADNRALRAAFELQVPLVYFVGTRPSWYRPFYPCFVVADDPIERRVLVTNGPVSNGLSLCAIHHRAFDHNLVGISADYEVRVSRTLLDDEDGPMLDVLKGFDRATIEVPVRKAWRPDRELLAHRFERFLSFGPRDHGSTSAASPGLPG